MRKKRKWCVTCWLASLCLLSSSSLSASSSVLNSSITPSEKCRTLLGIRLFSTFKKEECVSLALKSESITLGSIVLYVLFTGCTSDSSAILRGGNTKLQSLKIKH